MQSPEILSPQMPSTEKKPWTKPVLTKIAIGDAERRRPERKIEARRESQDFFFHFGPKS
jgi:hypothetical protein